MEIHEYTVKSLFVSLRGTLLGFVILLSYSHIAFGQRLDMTLNSVWGFHKGDLESVPDNVNNVNWEVVNIPHTWNAEDAFDDESGYYRGIGWYSKEISVPSDWKGKRVFIKFEGVNQNTTVYLNSDSIGNHMGGYSAFCFDLSDRLEYGTTNLLSVRVNNEHDQDIPPLNADFTFYGGIYRNVSLIITEPIHFKVTNFASDGVFISTPNVSEDQATIQVEGQLVNSSAIDKSVIIETKVLDREGNVVVLKSKNVTLSPNSETEFSMEGIKIQSPELWSPDDPYLYHAITEVREDSESSSVSDKVEIPMGCRWFEFDDEGGFWLNGNRIKLQGANRHQDFAGLGNALPDSYHFNDYKRIKELGFNFIRTAHYPQAQEVYRACDELGLLVWSEIPVVSGITDSESFAQNCLKMQREHIRQTINHPSMVFYGYMNEIFLGFQYNRSLSDADREKVMAATVELAKELEALTKAEAPDHFTVMAFHRSDLYNASGISDIPDVVGWNLYFGWYYENMEDLTTFLTEQHTRYPDKPMIVSEYGPGTDERIHAKNPKPWDYSEDYQYIMHASYLKQMMSMPFLAGFAAWNYADFGSERRGDAIPFVNQKGLVNFDRTEKDVTGLYRAYFLDDPVVHIASHNHTKRKGMEQESGLGICHESVKIFSNQETIELFLNGVKIGQEKVSDFEVTFEVPFRDGRNELIAISDKETKDQVVIDFSIIPFHMDEARNIDLAINVGAEVSFYDPDAEILWIPDRPYSERSWGYVDGAPYTVQQRQLKTGIDDNILGTDNDPLYQTFVEGLSRYQFDVPDGSYMLTLCFQEPVSRGRQTNMYNLTEGSASDNEIEEREFDIVVNGQSAIHHLNLEKEYGSLRAVKFDLKVNSNSNKGIKVDFRPLSGKALLSGIRLVRMD